MGNGKGNLEYYVAEIQPGKVLYEMDGVDEALAREAFRLAAAKLPVRTTFVAAARCADGTSKQLRDRSRPTSCRRSCSSCAREQFSLRMQKATRQLAKTDAARKVRRDIARVQARCIGREGARRGKK